MTPSMPQSSMMLFAPLPRIGGHNEHLLRAGDAMERIERSRELSGQWQEVSRRQSLRVQSEVDDVVSSVKKLLIIGELV